MLEYPTEEALSLLAKNQIAATTNISELSKDLDFLKEQITTTEVNMARIYNWDVQVRYVNVSSNRVVDSYQKINFIGGLILTYEKILTLYYWW